MLFQSSAVSRPIVGEKVNYLEHKFVARQIVVLTPSEPWGGTVGDEAIRYLTLKSLESIADRQGRIVAQSD